MHCSLCRKGHRPPTTLSPHPSIFSLSLLLVPGVTLQRRFREAEGGQLAFHWSSRYHLWYHGNRCHSNSHTVLQAGTGGIPEFRLIYNTLILESQGLSHFEHETPLPRTGPATSVSESCPQMAQTYSAQPLPTSVVTATSRASCLRRQSSSLTRRHRCGTLVSHI
jgi:hypothetical protein